MDPFRMEYKCLYFAALCLGPIVIVTIGPIRLGGRKWYQRLGWKIIDVSLFAMFLSLFMLIPNWPGRVNEQRVTRITHGWLIKDQKDDDLRCVRYVNDKEVSGRKPGQTPTRYTFHISGFGNAYVVAEYDKRILFRWRNVIDQKEKTLVLDGGWIVGPTKRDLKITTQKDAVFLTTPSWINLPQTYWENRDDESVPNGHLVTWIR